ncbi:TetR/AcrR family transcriptional regulator [Sinomonas halotolerans]|uniref:TetR/AcrR family transcriptional regulator n=1 Tax=Sinomonas halotolerans TaxID=1644133 RepID=A0ABU9WYK9_9MICC
MSVAGIVAGRAGETPREGRRGRRRRDTLAEILAISLDVMGEEGVGGLSLAEVARRMGIKPPSLYKHFASKDAVYDALFALGARAHHDAVAAAVEGMAPGLERLETGFEASIDWCIGNPVLTQLLFWRPVPGFVPSAEAYAPTAESIALLHEGLEECVAAGALREQVLGEEGIALFTSFVSGIVTQQLANEPGAGLASGRFTRHRKAAFASFVAHYAAGSAP